MSFPALVSRATYCERHTIRFFMPLKIALEKKWGKKEFEQNSTWALIVRTLFIYLLT